MDQEAFKRHHEARRKKLLENLREAMKSGIDPNELKKFPNEWLVLIARKGGEYETVILDHDKDLHNLRDRLRKLEMENPKIKDEIHLRFNTYPPHGLGMMFQY